MKKTMSESQTMEWKQSWSDKYLEWICGFANAQGGTLVIGKNDKGMAVGVAEAGRLLEEIPGKIRQQLGLVCNVNLRHENGLPLIEIYTPPLFSAGFFAWPLFLPQRQHQNRVDRCCIERIPVKKDRKNLG